MADEPKKDLETVKKELLETAKKDGKIEQEAIFAAIPETPENSELLDGLYTELADAGIPIGGVAAGPAALTDEWVADDEEELAAAYPAASDAGTEP
jgi:hypothetical protein